MRKYLVPWTKKSTAVAILFVVWLVVLFSCWPIAVMIAVLGSVCWAVLELAE
jgi:hypothetical protein